MPSGASVIMVASRPFYRGVEDSRQKGRAPRLLGCSIFVERLMMFVSEDLVRFIVVKGTFFKT